MENKFEQFVIFAFYNLKRHGVDEPSVEELYEEVRNGLARARMMTRDFVMPDFEEFKKTFEDLKVKGFL